MLRARPIAALLLCMALPGCSLARLFPGEVAMGVSRLSIVNASGILALISADERCGFASRAVLDAALLEGEPGEHGTYRLEMDDCQFDLGERTVVSENCEGEELALSGLITVRATMEIGGLLTGNPDQPVVPTDPDTTIFTVESTVESTVGSFAVQTGDSLNTLTQTSGSFGFQATPRLAALYDFPGICGYATPVIAFEDVRFVDAELIVASAASVVPFHVSVESSNLRAQIGQGPGAEENLIEGSLQVWGQDIEIPVEGDPGLDPDYDREEYEATFNACIDEQGPQRPLLPLTYVCPGIDRLLAVVAGQLTVEQVGVIADLVRADEICGFRSAEALASTLIEGEPGSLGAATTSVVDCALSFETATLQSTDCTGASFSVEGTVTVSALRTLAGVVTEDPDRPVNPTADDALSITLTRVTFDEFTVTTTTREESMTVHSGTLTGRVTPRLARSEGEGCTLETPITRFEDLQWADARAQLNTPDLVAAMTMPSSMLDATRGNWLETNTLGGTVEVNGEEYDLSPGVTGSLAPIYRQDEFDAAWQCVDGLELPVSFDCSDAP